MWAPRPPTPPPEDGQTGRGRGGALLGSRGRGPGAGRPGLPPPPSRHPGPGDTPSWEGDGCVSRLALCAARGRPQQWPGALSSLGRDGDRGFQARAPPPRARPPQLPRALRRRLLLRPLGLPPGSRPGGGCSCPPSPGHPGALRAGGRRGPLAIRPGAPRARAPLHSFRCRRGRPAGAGGEAGGGEGGEGGEAGGCWVTGGDSPPPPAACAPLPPRGPGDGRPRDPERPERSALTRARALPGDSGAAPGARRRPPAFRHQPGPRPRSARRAGALGTWRRRGAGGRRELGARAARRGRLRTERASRGLGGSRARAAGPLRPPPPGPRDSSLSLEGPDLETVTATEPLEPRAGQGGLRLLRSGPLPLLLKSHGKIRKKAREKEARGEFFLTGAVFQPG